MKNFYKVIITEKYEREVWVNAESPEKAKKQVEKEYRGFTHILQSGDYKETIFSVEQINEVLNEKKQTKN